jgi:hypothetical protein
MLGAAVRPTNRKPAVRHSRREQEGNYFSIFCSGRLGALGLDVPHARRWGRHCEVCQVESHSLFPLLLFFFFSLVVPLLLSGGRSFVLLLPPSSYGLSRTFLLVLLVHTWLRALPVRLTNKRWILCAPLRTNWQRSKVNTKAARTAVSDSPWHQFNLQASNSDTAIETQKTDELKSRRHCNRLCYLLQQRSENWLVLEHQEVPERVADGPQRPRPRFPPPPLSE